MTKALHFLTIAEAARRLEAKDLSPVELVEALLDRIESLNPQLDAACDAWNRLIDQPWTIMSIGLRDWAHNNHSL